MTTTTTLTTTGFLNGAHEVTNNLYHSDTSRVSKSGLDLINKSPLHFFEAKLKPDGYKTKETPALLAGRAIHLAVLERHLFPTEFAISPDFDKRTTKGKADFADWLLRVPGKTIIDLETYENCMRVADAVSKHPAARRLLELGVPEKTFYWTDPETGVQCKIRPDWITPEIVVVDLKTTEDASPDGFGRTAAKYRYDVQGAYYTDGLAANGNEPEGFVFIAVEKSPPYAVAVYYMDETTEAAGRTKYRRNLETYRDAKQTNAWPSYSDKITRLEFPAYALK